MAGPWVSANSILDAIARTIKKGTDRTALADWWADLAADARLLAYEDILSCLTLKGYTIDLLDSWDNREIVSKTQAVFRAFQLAGASSGIDEKAIEGLNQIPRLEAAPALVCSGVAVSPSSASEVGGMGGGTVTRADREDDDWDTLGFFR